VQYSTQATAAPTCKTCKVYAEKVSGAKNARNWPIRRLEAGDMLVVTRKAGAGFRSLSDAWADTTTPHGRLMLTILDGLAEFERELILARTGDGRARAKAKGVRFGRPRKLTPHQRQEAPQRLAEGEIQADVARTYNVDATTIGRLGSPSPFEVGAAVH
jgi:DNA invertase Pin-like site-specific DNA recombinase